VNTISVREHARLTVGPVAAASLDVASVPASAFDWLCRESQRHRAAGAPLVQLEDRRWLRLDNYVGVLETPCGTRIEILPKHVHGDTEVATARKVLVDMLRTALDLTPRESAPTALETFDAPVSEWIIQCFLQELNGLVRRGLRFDYRLVEEEVRFLRGRLRVAQQVRQPATRRHLFQVEHQVFDPNRPENRLIAKALAKVAAATRDAENWRLARELEHQLAEVQPSQDVGGDFRRWSRDRLMQHYRPIRTWCELILGDRNPMAVLGEWTGLSLLFPMEKVFERYVEGHCAVRPPLAHASEPRRRATCCAARTAGRCSSCGRTSSSNTPVRPGWSMPNGSCWTRPTGRTTTGWRRRTSTRCSPTATATCAARVSCCWSIPAARPSSRRWAPLTSAAESCSTPYHWTWRRGGCAAAAGSAGPSCLRQPRYSPKRTRQLKSPWHEKRRP
jgi:hypothetical protein